MTYYPSLGRAFIWDSSLHPLYTIRCSKLRGLGFIQGRKLSNSMWCSFVFTTCDVCFGRQKGDTSLLFWWYILSSYINIEHLLPWLFWESFLSCACNFRLLPFVFFTYLHCIWFYTFFSHLPYIYQLKVRFKLLCSILQFSLFDSFILLLYMFVIVPSSVCASVSWLLTSLLLHLSLCLTCVFLDGCKMTWFFSCRILSSNSVLDSEIKSICLMRLNPTFPPVWTTLIRFG